MALRLDLLHEVVLWCFVMEFPKGEIFRCQNWKIQCHKGCIQHCKVRQKVYQRTTWRHWWRIEGSIEPNQDSLEWSLNLERSRKTLAWARWPNHRSYFYPKSNSSQTLINLTYPLRHDFQWKKVVILRKSKVPS